MRSFRPVSYAEQVAAHLRKEILHGALRGDSTGVIDRTLTIGSGGITTAARAVDSGNAPATYGAVKIALGANQI